MTPSDIFLLIFAIVTVLAALAAILTLIFAYYAYRRVFTLKNRHPDPKRGVEKPSCLPYRDFIVPIIERMTGEKYEDLYVTSHDGLRLHAKYYKGENGKPVEIMLHGYKSTPTRDCCGSGSDVIDAGGGLLYVEQRAHGDSEGKTITFGVLERHDLLLWINKILEIEGKDTKIIVHGTSMGGATALMASGLDLPENVRCIIVDCPYSEPREIIESVLNSMKLPPRLVYPFIKLGAKIYGGFDLDGASADEAIAKTKTPIFIMHGDGDTFVPMYMSEALYKKYPDKVDFLSFKGADHCMSFLMYPEEYRRARDEFRAKHL